MNNDKVYQMNFSKVYPLLVNKAVKKGRTKEEADEIIRWLTGYSQIGLEEILEKPISYAEFFRKAPIIVKIKALRCVSSRNNGKWKYIKSGAKLRLHIRKYENGTIKYNEKNILLIFLKHNSNSM